MSEFRFKQFSIKQDKTAMKVSTDGVLLGAWIASKKPKRILDIGTGTAILSIMAAQKFPEAQITAIEIDNDAFLEAKENINNCPWKKRLKIFNTDFFDFCKISIEKYDLIISNPPYFDNQLKPRDKKKRIAKHSESLAFDKMIAEVSKILSPEGFFCVIIPFQRAETFIHLCAQNNLFVSRKTTIYPNENKKANRILLEFVRHICAIQDNFIRIREKGKYSRQYLELTKDFYLFA